MSPIRRGRSRAAQAPRQNHRGVAYWTDGRGDERILYITAGYHLIALNAKTGQPIRSFGTAGVVDLFDGLRPAASAERPDRLELAADDRRRHRRDRRRAARSSGKTKENVRRRTSAATTSAPASASWTFHTIPRPGEFGNETWENDSWSYTGNTGVWATDVGRPRARLRLPPDRDADQRFLRRSSARATTCSPRAWSASTRRPASGSGIFSSCTTASGTTTFRAPPILLDITVNGRRIKAVAQVTKQAFTYVFDRVTGAPVWPIEERPVPQSDVPGEKTSPTQPFPTKPAAFDRQGVTARRSDRLHAGAEQAEAREDRLAVQARSALHAADRGRRRTGVRAVLMLPTRDRRRELAGRRGRP